MYRFKELWSSLLQLLLSKTNITAHYRSLQIYFFLFYYPKMKCLESTLTQKNPSQFCVIRNVMDLGEATRPVVDSFTGYTFHYLHVCYILFSHCEGKLDVQHSSAETISLWMSPLVRLVEQIAKKKKIIIIIVIIGEQSMRAVNGWNVEKESGHAYTVHSISPPAHRIRALHGRESLGLWLVSFIFFPRLFLVAHFFYQVNKSQISFNKNFSLTWHAP